MKRHFSFFIRNYPARFFEQRWKKQVKDPNRKPTRYRTLTPEAEVFCAEYGIKRGRLIAMREMCHIFESWAEKEVFRPTVLEAEAEVPLLSKRLLDQSESLHQLIDDIKRNQVYFGLLMDGHSRPLEMSRELDTIQDLCDELNRAAESADEVIRAAGDVSRKRGGTSRAGLGAQKLIADLVEWLQQNVSRESRNPNDIREAVEHALSLAGESIDKETIRRSVENKMKCIVTHPTKKR